MTDISPSTPSITDADSSPTPPPLSTSGRGVMAFSLGMISFLLSLGACFLAFVSLGWFPELSKAFKNPPIEDTAQISHLAQLSDRISLLEQNVKNADHAVAEKLTALETAFNAPPPQPPSSLNETSLLSEELERLSQRVEGIERRFEKAAVPVAHPSSSSAHHAAIVLAAGQLRTAVAQGRPYLYELHTLRSLVLEQTDLDPALRSLEKSAATGLPTLHVLTNRFPSVAKDALKASRSQSGNGWLNGVHNMLEEAVTIRQVGPNVPGDSVDAFLARAEDHLRHQNLRGATQEVSMISDLKAAALLKPWLDQANEKLAAEDALDALMTGLVRLDTLPPPESSVTP